MTEAMMIERVARALAEDFIDNELDNIEVDPEVYADMNWENFAHKAKVAIAAMREPTDGMRRTVAADWGHRTWRQYGEVIDAALEGK